MQPTQTDLAGKATQALKFNDLGECTRPAAGLYPHQWLWDSCFIAIGLRHVDITRAQAEIRSLVKGQWKNGMLPHIIFYGATNKELWQDEWESKRHPDAKQEFETSAITQPPIVAEAVVKIGSKLGDRERIDWYREMYPVIYRYHEWLYRERDPQNIGLAFLVHSWESGLDDTPPWTHMNRVMTPLKFRLASMLKLGFVFDWGRFDKKFTRPEERVATADNVTLFKILDELRNRNYNLDSIYKSKIPLVMDVVFNSVFVRANDYLRHIAREIGEQIPPDMDARMQNSVTGLQNLLADDGVFYSRDYRSGRLVQVPSIGSLMPLYSGAITNPQAEIIVQQIKNEGMFWLPYPVPTVPKNSPAFSPIRYWHGPVWVNMNWFIIDGLRRYRYNDLANELAAKTLKMVGQAGIYEYYSPLDGRGLGAAPFSWTAALTLDLLHPHQQ